MGSQSLTYHYDRRNRLARVTGGREYDFSYDARGNVTHNSRSGFTYNLANQLVNSGSLAAFKYDGYYDPVIGRFYSNDPVTAGEFIGEGNIHGFNRYAYANNNPYKFIDPDGLAPGDPFDSPEDAGEDAVQFINETSIKENKEYGGTINRQVTTATDGEGNTKGTVKYVATQPMEGQEDRVEYSINPKTTVGSYHTHGDYSRENSDGSIIRTSKSRDGFNSDNFSDRDRVVNRKAASLTKAARKARGEKFTAVLGTPSGRIKVSKRR